MCWFRHGVFVRGHERSRWNKRLVSFAGLGRGAFGDGLGEVFVMGASPFAEAPEDRSSITETPEEVSCLE